MKYEIIILKTPEISGLPVEIQIVPLGEYTDSAGRKFRITPEDILTIITNSRGKVNEIVIDYEHQTLAGSEAPAAAWIKSLTDKGAEGLWAIVEWTERARKYLENKEYRYLSPVLLARKIDKDGLYRPEILHSAALTNTPQIDGMVPIVNRLNGANILNNARKEKMFMEKLLEALGLTPESTEDEAIAALAVLKNKAAASAPESENLKSELKKIKETLGLQETANLSETTGTIIALKQPGNVVSVQEFQALKQRLAEKERDELVTLAMNEGKISAAQKEWAEAYALRDIEGFKVFVAKAPVVVPMGAMPPGKPEGDAALDETNLLVAKMFGNKPEAVKKVQAYYKTV